MRTIFHVDMDAFYTSVEQRDQPEYRGKPVVVGADPKGGRGRGVVAAASYEARRFGVHSAMPIGRAYRACPHAIFLTGDMRKYQTSSSAIMDILHSYSDLVEPISIDEAFVDMTAICRPEKAAALAREVKDHILREERLNASIGVAPNKFLAKIASDLDKPDGLVVVAPGDELSFLEPLPVERLWGVGPKTAERLHRQGYRLIKDLWSVESDELSMGKHGEHILRLARGLDARDVVPERAAKSIGHETTFLEDTDDAEVVRNTLLELAEAVAVRLRRHGVRGRTVTLKFRDEDFVTETRARSLQEPTDDAKRIFDTAFALLSKVKGRTHRVRLLGISLSKLSAPEDRGQMSLFDAAADDKSDRLSRARDQLEEKFGKGSIRRASLLDSRGLTRDV